MGIRDLLFIGLVIGGTAGLAASLYPPRVEVDAGKPPKSVRDDGVRRVAARVDAGFREGWDEAGITPARRAEPLTVVRRLALGLTGAVPSLEEVRIVQSWPEPERVARYVGMVLEDRRFADYFAERFSRAFVGTEGGPFLVFRRRRFLSWLSDGLMENRPYDAIVRDLIASDGLWTDRPATNFLTVTYDPDRKMLDPERLAGRVTRAFLGARLDCAQCHDHPFAPWKQRDFQGLAAFFGRAQSGFTGIHEEESAEFSPVDRKTGKPRTVVPFVPFSPELLPGKDRGNRRQRLASWVTHPKNRAFARATVNRVWALMVGKPLVEPVDDVATTSGPVPKALDVLAEEFAGSGFNLKRLVRVIAATEVYGLESALPEGATREEEEGVALAWGMFPLSRLRPEQVVGGVLQATTLSTIDADSPLVQRLFARLGQNGFVERYGDTGEDEFDARGGTIPQRLLLMNGELVRDKTMPNLMNAGNRIGLFAPDDEAAVRVAYLAVLTRSPTAEELRHFAKKLAGTKGGERSSRMSDLFWTLVNATEFSWNH